TCAVLELPVLILHSCACRRLKLFSPHWGFSNPCSTIRFYGPLSRRVNVRRGGRSAGPPERRGLHGRLRESEAAPQKSAAAAAHFTLVRHCGRTPRWGSPTRPSTGMACLSPCARQERR